MRSFAKGKELTMPTVIKGAMNYLTLKSIMEAKATSKAMFDSNKWKTNSYRGKWNAMKVKYTMLVDNFF